MTNKKKATTSTKRNKQTKSNGDNNKQQSIADSVYGPTPENPFGNRPSEPVQYTRSQLVAVVFFGLGLSRFMEWQRALNQMTGPEGSFLGNGTATTCKEYMLTNNETGVDYDDVCDSEVTLAMMSLKYDVSCLMIFIVGFLMVQCWSNDTLLSQLNAVLTMTPVSTSLLLLQLVTPYICPRRSKLLTIGSGILMFLSLPATGNVLREFRTNNNNSNKNGIVMSLALGGMMLMYLFEAFQWSVTANYNNTEYLLGTTYNNVMVLSADSLTDWNEAWTVFMYTLMYDKITMVALLGCVWVFFDEGRQRRFLLIWGVAKFYEYTVVLPSYAGMSLQYFNDLDLMKDMALACSIISGIAWIAPTVVLGDNNGSGSNDQKGNSKVKAA